MNRDSEMRTVIGMRKTAFRELEYCLLLCLCKLFRQVLQAFWDIELLSNEILIDACTAAIQSSM